jgi:hypothetical protein
MNCTYIAQQSVLTCCFLTPGSSWLIAASSFNAIHCVNSASGHAPQILQHEPSYIGFSLSALMRAWGNIGLLQLLDRSNRVGYLVQLIKGENWCIEVKKVIAHQVKRDLRVEQLVKRPELDARRVQVEK